MKQAGRGDEVQGWHSLPGYGPVELQPGTTLQSRYTIETVLGRGGMGTVYSAEDKFLSRRVCIKLLRQDLIHDEQHRKRFLREGKVLAGLQHTNIVRCFQLGLADDGTPFLVMEHIEGASLRQLLESGRCFTWQESIALIGCICDALTYAHNAKLLHRDLKPENILITIEDGAEIAKVIDFGIAKWLADGTPSGVTQPGVVLGSPRYMSPEQAHGHVEIDTRADIYSLGCILYELISGAPPFDGDSALAILNSHCTQTASDLIADRTGQPVPTSLNSALSRCLAKDPALRYGTALEMHTSLDSILERPAATHAPPPTTRGRLTALLSATLITTSALFLLCSSTNSAIQQHEYQYLVSGPLCPQTSQQWERWADAADAIGANVAARLFRRDAAIHTEDQLERGAKCLKLLQSGAGDSNVIQTFVQTLHPSTKLSKWQQQQQEQLLRDAIKFFAKHPPLDIQPFERLLNAYPIVQVSKARLLACNLYLQAAPRAPVEQREHTRLAKVHILLAMRKTKEVKEELALAEQDAKNCTEFLVAWANSYVVLDDIDKAEQLLNLYLKQSHHRLEDEPLACVVAARIYNARKDTEHALHYSKIAFENRPFEQWGPYAEILTQLNQTEELKRVAKILESQNLPVAAIRSATLFHQAGLPLESWYYVDRALDIWDNKPYEDVNLEWLTTFALLSATNQPTSILEHLTKTLASWTPSEPRMKLQRVQLLIRATYLLKRFDQCKNYYRSLVNSTMLTKALADFDTACFVYPALKDYARFLQQLGCNSELRGVAQEVEGSCNKSTEQTYAFLSVASAIYRTLGLYKDELSCREHALKLAQQIALNSPEHQNLCTESRVLIAHTHMAYGHLDVARTLLQECSENTLRVKEAKLRLDTVEADSYRSVWRHYQQFYLREHFTPPGTSEMAIDRLFDQTMACKRAANHQQYIHYLKALYMANKAYEGQTSVLTPVALLIDGWMTKEGLEKK